MRPSQLVASTLFLTACAAFAGEPGNLWDITSSMEMSGMKMPGQKQQVCLPVNAEGPEAMAKDDRCKISDVQRSPGKFTYKVQCPDGSGSGEMTYQGKDNYTSKMTMTTDGETMTMVTTGKRAGSCDASQPSKQMAAVQAQAAAGMKEACAGSAEAMIPATLINNKCDPRYKKQLCDRLGTKEGFLDVAGRKPMGDPTIDSSTLPEVAKFCGTQPEAIRTKLCSNAGKTEDFDFIGAQCPSLAQPIAQRECAGRSFSSPPAPRYRSFCGSYGKGVMGGNGSSGERERGEPGVSVAPEAPATPETPTTPTDKLKEGAKRLKGLFGR